MATRQSNLDRIRSDPSQLADYAGRAHLLCHLPRRRDRLHDDAQLVAGRALERLERSEDGVAAINGVMQFVPRWAEALGRLLPGPGDDRVDILDRVRVAHPDHADKALAELAGALELGAQLCGRTDFGPVMRVVRSLYCW
jgi:hypothetical protein